MSPEDYEQYKRLQIDSDKRADKELTKNLAADYPDLPAIVPEGCFRFEVTLQAETVKAYLLRFDDIEHWMPKTQIVGIGWAQGLNPEDVLFCADLKDWIVDNKNLLA